MSTKKQKRINIVLVVVMIIREYEKISVNKILL